MIQSKHVREKIDEDGKDGRVLAAASHLVPTCTIHIETSIASVLPAKVSTDTLLSVIANSSHNPFTPIRQTSLQEQTGEREREPVLSSPLLFLIDDMSSVLSDATSSKS